MAQFFQFTPLAVDDLEAIVNYIAQDKIGAAIRVQSAILAACKRLSQRPLMGARHPDITPLPVRFWPVSRFPNYIVVYLPDTRPLQVVAVLHGMRDVQRVLSQRPNP